LAKGLWDRTKLQEYLDPKAASTWCQSLLCPGHSSSSASCFPANFLSSLTVVPLCAALNKHLHEPTRLVSPSRFRPLLRDVTLLFRPEKSVGSRRNRWYAALTGRARLGMGATRILLVRRAAGGAKTSSVETNAAEILAVMVRKQRGGGPRPGTGRTFR